MSTLNLSPCTAPHTTTCCRPTQIGMTSQHINSGRYTISNSKLIEHISDDTDDELDITQGDIVTDYSFDDIATEDFVDTDYDGNLDAPYDNENTGIQLTDKEKMHLCLTEIENLLQANRKSLRDFPSMPYPLGYAANPHQNNLIYNELAYDRDILAAEFDKCYQSLTAFFLFLFASWSQHSLFEIVSDHHHRYECLSYFFQS
ncbi:hypothetical protein JHK86_040335 [Glycine max]|nr:hypothetical protein JHK86_040335 [Glycine max]